MKIALILPPVTLEERYNKAVARMAGSLPPLGLISIATVLKNAGHETIVLDGSIQSFEEVILGVEKFAPDIAGITAMTMMWPKVRVLSAKLKERMPGIKIIVGGVHTSMIKEKALHDIPQIDAVSWGEGEFSMLEYAEKAVKRGSDKPIDGISFRTKEGKIISGPDRKSIEDLNILPIPDRRFVPIDKYVSSFEQYKRLPVTNMLTTRGCPFKCIFCLPDLLGDKVRYRDAGKVVEEIEYLLNDFGVKDIAFWDDTFTLNKKRVFAICETIIAKKLKFIWSAQARADCVTPEMLAIMKRAGCWKLFFGVESLVQKNLDTLRKGETVKQIFDAVRWTREAGIEVETSFIFGIPGETFADGLETIRLAKKLDSEYAKFFFLTPYGKFLEEAKKCGRVLTEGEEGHGGSKIKFIPSSMTKEELSELYYRAYRQFYFRPKMILKRLFKMLDPLELKKTVNGLRALISFSIEETKCKSRQKSL